MSPCTRSTWRWWCVLRRMESMAPESAAGVKAEPIAEHVREQVERVGEHEGGWRP